MGTQPSGGSSVPKISAVPVTSRTRRGASGSTSTRSSLCGARLYCRGGCAAAAPAAAAAAAMAATARVGRCRVAGGAGGVGEFGRILLVRGV